MKNLIIFGTGQIAELAHFYFTNDSKYQVVAFTVDQDHIKETTFHNLSVVPFENVQKIYPPSEYTMFIALSYAKQNKIRALKYFQAKEKKYELATYISSKATIWNTGTNGATSIGDNCFILENQVIQPFTIIGNNVVLWSGNHIGHHSKIKDHSFLAPQVAISGNVTIESYCFIGINATIRNGITIGEKSIIGAGALIMHDVQPGSVYKPDATKIYKKRSIEVGL